MHNHKESSYPSLPPPQSNKIIYALLLTGIIIRLIILFQPFETLFGRWGSDDSFYYSQIAGNFANTGLFTFDGMELTNGFQPLFMFLLLPFGKLMFNDIHSSLFIMLGVTSILTIIAAFQIPKLFREYGLNQQLGLIVTGLFVLHPKIISVTFNGTEAALSFLMIILSLRAFKWIQGGQKLVLSSLIFGGLVLTRMDFSLLLFLLFATAVIQRHSFVNWAKVLLLPIVLFSAWLAINYHYFDSILPSSGTAKALHSEVIESNHLGAWLSTYSTALMSESKLSIVLLTLCLFGCFYAYQQKSSQYKNYSFFLFGLSAICGIVPIISIGSFRDWYLIPHFLLVLFLSSQGIIFLLRKTKFKLIVCLVILGGIWTEAQFSRRKFNGTYFVQAGQQFDKRIPKEMTVGSFNAGVINCSMSNRTVVNLDGVVNNGILQYYENHNLQMYLKMRDIHYIIDNKSSIDFFLQNFSNQQDWIIIDRFTLDKQELVLVHLL